MKDGVGRWKSCILEHTWETGSDVRCVYVCVYVCPYFEEVRGLLHANCGRLCMCKSYSLTRGSWVIAIPSRCISGCKRFANKIICASALMSMHVCCRRSLCLWLVAYWWSICSCFKRACRSGVLLRFTWTSTVALWEMRETLLGCQRST